MFSKTTVLGILLGLGCLMGVVSNISLAQMPTGMPGMSAHSSESTSQFHQINQPLGLKTGVTLGGIALIGLELWWFILSKQYPTSRGTSSNTVDDN